MHATSNAVTGPSPQGSFYSIEIQNVTLSGTSGTATLVMNRANNGSISTLYSASIAVHSGTVVKSIVIPSQRITVFVDGAFVADLGDSSSNWVSTGQPGVGMFSAPSGNSVSLVQLGAWDPNYPSAVDTATVAAYALSTSIRLRWQPPPVLLVRLEPQPLPCKVRTRQHAHHWLRAHLPRFACLQER